MIGYDPLHTDTKLDFIHSLIHTLIHSFTLSLGGPLTVCLFFEIQVFGKIKMHKSEAFHTIKLILVVIFSWRSLKGFQNLAILGVPQTLPRLGASWAARPTLADGEG